MFVKYILFSFSLVYLSSNTILYKLENLKVEYDLDVRSKI